MRVAGHAPAASLTGQLFLTGPAAIITLNVFGAHSAASPPMTIEGCSGMAMPTTGQARAPGAGFATQLIVAAAVGNALEFYEILVYGYFAVTIAKVFFPAADPAVSILVTLGTVLCAVIDRSHRLEAGAELLHHGDGAAQLGGIDRAAPKR